ncbi:LysR family transcriptional regulator [Sedimenticola selenatireducens]|jgi:DNA-binding transcriptional LysR family regulator|uniref:LysR family transcriptional regulator n=1 Tax=Sedimenticola selenatireducens TaxID=191960 RepID=A0A557SK94_9GAMM|nr:LysR family transcriptional regulator [Sedimenticola selenatireducens]TVO77834.1 LysR family transcriptional regulator [Sedimenticola selenatireducens]TVT65139.1 MAG: LysR family transcriptional regulator [Sedimenticola selenatireducens]
MKQYDLISLRSFVAVVNSGSFNKAAEQLETSTAAISRRVASLEAELGVRLLNRTTRRIDLTESGRQYHADVTAILEALEEAEERINCDRQAISGSLRIAAPLSFGTQCLGPLLPPFLQRHPELRLQVQLEDRFTDLIADQVDLSIRIGSLTDSSYVATHITELPRVVCASPGYIKCMGMPRIPADLKSHNCLHYNNVTLREEWGFRGDNGAISVEVGGTFCANNGELLRDAALQGVGVISLPQFIVQEALDKAQLIPLLTAYTTAPMGLYVLRPTRSFTPARIQLFIEYLKSAYTNPV